MGSSPLYPFSGTATPSGAAGGVLTGTYPNPSGLAPVAGVIPLGASAGSEIVAAPADSGVSAQPTRLALVSGRGGNADNSGQAKVGGTLRLQGGRGGDGSADYDYAAKGGDITISPGLAGTPFGGGAAADNGDVHITGGTPSGANSGTINIGVVNTPDVNIGNDSAGLTLRGSIITIGGKAAAATEILQSRASGDINTRSDLRIKAAPGPDSADSYGVYGGYFFLTGGDGGAGDGSYPGQQGGNVLIYGGAGGTDGGSGQGLGGSLYLRGGAGATGGAVVIDGGDGPVKGIVSIGTTRSRQTAIGNSTSGSTLSFFGVSPQVRQTGGDATAGAVYTATEQTMIQKAYNCLRAFGFLS